MSVVILARTHLVRQPIAQSFVPLDLRVHEFSDPSDVVARLNTLSPDLLIMDADGMAREWRMLAAGLGMSRTSVALVLLTSRFSFEEAHQASAFNVSGVVVKPFRKEEHTARILDLALLKKGIRARRLSPRFSLAETSQARLPDTLSVDQHMLSVKNISEGGIAVSLETPDVVDAFCPGAFIPMATLARGESQATLSLEVVHGGEATAGMRFDRFFEGKQIFRALEEQHARAFGSQETKRKW